MREHGGTPVVRVMPEMRDSPRVSTPHSPILEDSRSIRHATYFGQMPENRQLRDRCYNQTVSFLPDDCYQLPNPPSGDPVLPDKTRLVRTASRVLARRFGRSQIV